MRLLLRAMRVLLTVVWMAMAGCTGGEPEAPDATVEDVLPQAVQSTGDGSLVLANLHLTDEVLQAVLADAGIPPLKSATLTENRLTAEGVKALMASDKSAPLAWLNVASNRIGDAGFEALAGAPGFASVTQLFAAGNGATDKGITALASSPNAAGLTYLSVGDQAVGDAGAQALLKLTALGRLELPRAEIGGAGGRALIEGTAADALSLEGNPIGPGGLKGLKGFAPGMSTLSLKGAGLTLDDIAALAALDGAGDLRELSLQDNAFGDAGVAAVGQIPWLQELDKLQLEGSGCGKEARAKMRKDWGTRGGLKIEPR